ncbi:opsin 1 protein [Uncinocarpus reesii 1704]|uniref:Opsin 1 protein n=1 Tax=Uncinocarpus reesii (strain UAMH 1704) TaxID=336963 RepID=C4JFN8_UNCRE|nr:opsin 1 protein [Uncinocarpus reesii 1704]EEP77523.1 opsin 1 protein [Uncinocarpus reesii 1704]
MNVPEMMDKPHIPPIGHPPVFQELGGNGKRCLWVVTILMLVSSLIFYILGARVVVQKRLFHVLTSLITTISFLAYFAMATGEGIGYNLVTIRHHHDKAPDTVEQVFRQVFWVRWLNWGLSFSLILVNLALLAGLNGASLLISVAANIIMFVTGLISVFGGHGGTRWAWFTISCLSYLTILYHTGFHGRRATLAKDNQTRAFYSSIAGYFLVLLLIYPIIWAASSNTRRMSVDAEIIIYAILDVLSQGVFGYWLLVSHDSMQSITLNIDGFWSNGIGNEGAIRVGDNEGA